MSGQMRHRPSFSQDWQQQQQGQGQQGRRDYYDDGRGTPRSQHQAQASGVRSPQTQYSNGQDWDARNGGAAYANGGDAYGQQQTGYANGGYSNHGHTDVVDDYYGGSQQDHHDPYYQQPQRDDRSMRSYGSQAHLNSAPEYVYDAAQAPPVPFNGGFSQDSYPPSSPMPPYGSPAPPHFAYQMPSPQLPMYQPTAYNLHRQKVLNRRSMRKVELKEGNLVLECPVPKSILTYSDYKGSDMREESSKMRYTAITCDPDEFTAKRFTVRQHLYKRETELFIVLTMYNEDEKLFCRTMTSVIKNIQFLQSRTKSKTWGAQSWKKVVVCVVSDGRMKVNPRTLKVLGLYGVYQDGIAKDTVAGKDVQAHLFEYTTQVVVDDDGVVKGGIAPVQVMFLLKEQNKKKLNSHRWFFNAFCPQIRPNVCILLDVGTKPSGTSIYSLWKAFDKNARVGGACGEITVDSGRGCVNLLNPLQAAQNFEYKMSNILDKPLESVFGFISVLPGAFSAYRYKALLGEPLRAYFLGEKMHEPGATATLYESNMYLAEDRVICFEMVVKKKEAWVLRYVKSAKASTDCPNNVPEFILQRRRWLNGSFFAAVHSTANFGKIWTSGQGPFRKFFLTILFLYNMIQLLFQFIALSSFYLATYFILSSATSDPDNDPFGAGNGADVLNVVTMVYVGILGIIIVCSLGNRPQGSRWAYIGVMIALSLIFGISLYCAGWTIWLAVPHTLAGWSHFDQLIQESAFRDIVISLAATYGLYIISSVIHAEPWHLFTSFLQYLFLLPSFVSVLGIYSFSNLHDISWGNREAAPAKDLGGAKKTNKADGKELVEVDLPTAPEDIDSLWQHMKTDLNAPQQEVKQKRDADTKKRDSYANIRTNTLLLYLGTNMILVMFFTSTLWTNFLASRSSSRPVVNYYLVMIFWSVAVLSAFRFLGSTAYLVMRLFGH